MTPRVKESGAMPFQTLQSVALIIPQHLLQRTERKTRQHVQVSAEHSLHIHHHRPREYKCRGICRNELTVMRILEGAQSSLYSRVWEAI
jgi:hypothetical protein